ncbi:hypothetical protein MKW98_029764, partial [Papaver atlanticum]
MVKKKTKELQLRSSTPKKLDKAPPEPNVTLRKSPRLIAKATNNLNSSSRKVVLDLVMILSQHSQLKQVLVTIYICTMDSATLYSDGEDATEWTDFCNNFKEVSGAGPSVRGGRSDYGDQEDNSEDDGYEQLLETNDEAEGNVDELIACVCYLYAVFIHIQFVSFTADKLKIDGPVIDLGPDFFTNALEEDNGLKVVNGSPVDQSIEIPNGRRQWFNDYEDIFGEDSLDNGELFPEDAGVEQVVEPGLVEVGTQFSDKLAFKRHLRAYCSDNLRIRVVCKFSGPPINCQWFMYVRKLPNEPTFSIKGFCLEHTCIGNPLGRNSSANPEFVAQCVIEKLKTSTASVLPKPAEIANDFWTSHNTLIPYHVAWKARNIMLEKINGSYDESYKLVPSLCEMIRRTNPGSIAKFTYG